MDSSRSAKALKKALLTTRDLLERLRADSLIGDSTADEQEDGGYFVMFVNMKLGGIRISGALAEKYRECIEKLADIHGRNSAERTLSRDAVERLLRNTILRTLRPKKNVAGETRAKFEGRLTRELLTMRKALGALPSEWRVAAQVQGLGPPGLPFAFGGVEFGHGKERGQEVAANLLDWGARHRRFAAAKIAAENATRQTAREELSESFSGHALASVTVRAVDNEAAKHLGIERIRRTVDILNFFAPFLQELPRVYRAYLAPEGTRTALVWAAHAIDGGALHSSTPWPAANPHVLGMDVSSPRAIEVGLSRASELLGREGRSDLDDRVVNALAWAGRAFVEPRRDQAFLLYAIALEALLTKPNSRAGVTDRVRLRAAHLIGRGTAMKRRVFALMARLYEIRSALVHSGDSGDLTDSDLKAMAEVVERALTGVLTDERFTRMRTAADFDIWFEGQLLA